MFAFQEESQCTINKSQLPCYQKILGSSWPQTNDQCTRHCIKILQFLSQPHSQGTPWMASLAGVCTSALLVERRHRSLAPKQIPILSNLC